MLLSSASMVHVDPNVELEIQIGEVYSTMIFSDRAIP